MAYQRNTEKSSSTKTVVLLVVATKPQANTDRNTETEASTAKPLPTNYRAAGTYPNRSSGSRSSMALKYSPGIIHPDR